MRPDTVSKSLTRTAVADTILAVRWLYGAFLIGWFAAWTVTVILHGAYRCPACHRLFHIRGLFNNVFATRCMHCGLPL